MTLYRFVSEEDLAAELGEPEEEVLNVHQPTAMRDGVYGYMIPCGDGDPEAENLHE